MKSLIFVSGCFVSVPSSSSEQSSPQPYDIDFPTREDVTEEDGVKVITRVYETPDGRSRTVTKKSVTESEDGSSSTVTTVTRKTIVSGGRTFKFQLDSKGPANVDEAKIEVPKQEKKEESSEDESPVVRPKESVAVEVPIKQKPVESKPKKKRDWSNRPKYLGTSLQTDVHPEDEINKAKLRREKSMEEPIVLTREEEFTAKREHALALGQPAWKSKGKWSYFSLLSSGT